MRIGLVWKIDQSNIAILVSKFARRATREKATHQLASSLLGRLLCGSTTIVFQDVSEEHILF